MLSPLLWCLVDDLIARLSAGGIHIQGYTDDICRLAVGKFSNTVPELMQRALLTVEISCNEVGLSANPDKTEFIVFTRKRKLPGFFDPNFFGVTLHRSRSVRYLWVILDSRLTWREHVDVKMRNVHNLLWACRRACRARWGLGPKVVHFSSLVWWPGSQPVQRKD